MRIAIFEEVGKRCMIKEDGQRIFESVHGPLLAGHKVTLDFAGVTQVASPFFNFAIGQLLKDIACLLYTSPSPRDRQKSRMPSSA